MDIYEAIKKRYSVRAYKDQPIDQARLDRVLEAARAAPTGRNRQAFKIIVVRDGEQRRLLSAAAGQPFIGQAPLVLAVVGLTIDEVMRCKVPADPVDCAIVLDHISLAAAAEGLGTCWIGSFDQDACCRVLDVPPGAAIIELMPLGYPLEPPRDRKPRKPLAELVCYDRFTG